MAENTNPSARPTVEMIQKDLADVKAQRDAYAEQLGTLTAGLESRGLVPDDADLAQFDSVGGALGAIDGLQKSLSAQKGQTTRAKTELKKAKSAERDPKAKARAIPPRGELVNPSPQDLLDAIEGAETVEVVASNGRAEILGILPLSAPGKHNWKVAANGLQLAVPQWLVQGPGPREEPYRVAGWGPVLDGECVAFRARGDQLNIGPGATMNLAGDVIF